jgi:hypothetical protein
LTPAHASWLDQGELLNHAFDGRYLTQSSWSSRAESIAHVSLAWPEYNRLYAHPFEWTWTNNKDAAMVRGAWALNSLHYFRRETLAVQATRSYARCAR